MSERIPPLVLGSRYDEVYRWLGGPTRSAMKLGLESDGRIVPAKACEGLVHRVPEENRYLMVASFPLQPLEQIMRDSASPEVMRLQQEVFGDLSRMAVMFSQTLEQLEAERYDICFFEDGLIEVIDRTSKKTFYIFESQDYDGAFVRLYIATEGGLPESSDIFKRTYAAMGLLVGLGYKLTRKTTQEAKLAVYHFVPISNNI